MTASSSDANTRSPEQIRREGSLTEISDVLLNLEHSLSRAKKALQRVRKLGGDYTIELALSEAIADIEKTHKRLMHDTYYAGDSVRLI